MEALSPELALVDAELAAVARAELAPAPDVFAALERSRANRDVVRQLRASFDAQQTAAAQTGRSRSGMRRRLGGVAFASMVAVGAIVTGALALGRDDVPEPRALASNASAPAPAPRSRPAPRRAVGAAVVHRAAPAEKPKPVRTPAGPKPTRKAVVSSRPAVATPKPARKAPPRVDKTPASAMTNHSPKAAPVLSWPLARAATYYRVRVYRVTGQFLFEVWSDKTRLAVPATWRTGLRQNRLTPGRYGWAVYPAFGDLGEPSAGPAAARPLAGGHFTV